MRAHFLGPSNFSKFETDFSYIAHNSKLPWSQWEEQAGGERKLKSCRKENKIKIFPTAATAAAALGHAQLLKYTSLYFKRRRMFKLVFPSFIYVLLFLHFGPRHADVIRGVAAVRQSSWWDESMPRIDPIQVSATSVSNSVFRISSTWRSAVRIRRGGRAQQVFACTWHGMRDSLMERSFVALYSRRGLN